MTRKDQNTRLKKVNAGLEKEVARLEGIVTGLKLDKGNLQQKNEELYEKVMSLELEVSKHTDSKHKQFLSEQYADDLEGQNKKLKGSLQVAFQHYKVLSMVVEMLFEEKESFRKYKEHIETPCKEKK